MSSHGDGQDDAAACAALVQLIAAAAGTVAAEVRPGARLHEDLGVDSLEMAALLVDIEHHFDVVITAEALGNIHTVDDLRTAVAFAVRETTG